MNASTEELQAALGEAYTLERELGRGGMGAVFLARDNRLHRPVAIKLLPPDLATNADLRERFLRETRLAASFSHPNIVPVHDVIERGNLLAFVMGYVDGETLGARVRRGGPLPLPDAVRVLQEVAWALSYAHGRGIVHRDIKPDNILIERATGRGLVTDFGIARSGVATPGQGLTRVGEVVGTPEFISPEQASGDVVDGRSDLYSLGVVAFYILAGQLPFDAPTPTGLLAMHLTQPPPSLAALRPDLPPEMVAAVERCLAKNPSDRFATGEELANALDGLRRSAPEVAPAVRVFLQRIGTSFFALLFLGGCASYLVRRGAKAGSDDWVIAFLMIIAAIWGLIAQLFGRVRLLLRQGFRYRDVHAGAGAILADDVAARDAIRASSDEMRRRRKRIRIGLLSCVWPFGAFWFVKHYLRTPIPGGEPGQFHVGAAGALIVISAAISLGLGVTLLGSDPLKGNPFAFLQAKFWQGPFGRLIFRIGGWRLPNVSDSGTTVTRAMPTAPGGPLTVLLALPNELRRDLRGVDVRLTALEREIVAGRGREAQIAAAIADAGPPQAAASERATALVQELGEAASVARREREAKELQLENVRLELIRLRAGLGTAVAVRQALEG
ncbi:MAG: serine/threonine-protein kinase [Gemmatimonadota bacterium]